MTRQISPLSLGLLGLMALLLAALWWAPGAPAAWRQWRAPDAQAPQLDELTGAALRLNPAAVAVYPAVLQRPLLSAARRPQAAASSAAAAPSAPPPSAIEQVRLQGIVAGPTLNGVFLQEEGQSRFVRRGEQVGDWTLETIRRGDIVFRRGTERRVVELLPTAASAESTSGNGWKNRRPAKPGSMSDTRNTLTFSMTMAMAAALWPPSSKPARRRSTSRSRSRWGTSPEMAAAWMP